MSEKKQKYINIAVGMVLLVGWIIGGIYLGGFVFLKLTKIEMSNLQFDTLWYYWQRYNGDPHLKKMLYISIIAGIAFVVVPVVIVLFAWLSGTKEEIHGSARMANDRDLAKSGFFDGNHTTPTLLLGKMNKGRYKGRYVEVAGQSFVGVSAPTGSGKGVGFVLPNMVHYSDSVVCFDIKLENFIKSAGFRAKSGQDVYLFAPDGYAVTQSDADRSRLRSHRWNAFGYIRRSKAYRTGDVQVLSTSLYPKHGDKNDMWNNLAGKLFTGLTLWMLDTEILTGVEPTFTYLLSVLGVEGGFYKWMRNELTQDYLSEECEKEFRAFLNYPNETQGSILANLEAPLGIFADKTVAAAVACNDFDLRDLRRKGISVYVGVQPPNKSRFQLLLNLFFEQVITENTRVTPERDISLTHQLLLMNDEFPALGRVNQIKESIGYTRQYNVRYALIYQDKSQLEDKSLYDKEGADNIISNLLCEVIYPPSSVTPRVEAISKTLGTKTVKVASNSISSGKGTSRTTNYSPQKRELLKPHEIIEIGYEKHPAVTDLSTKVLMFKQGQRPFIMDKLISFDDPLIADRIEYAENNVPEIPLLTIS